MDSGRRKLIIGGVTILGGLALGGGMLMEQCSRPSEKKPAKTLEQLSMKEFLQQQIFGKRGRKFEHPLFAKKTSRNFRDAEAVKVIARVGIELEKYFGDLSRLEMRRETSFYELAVSDDAFSEYRRRIEAIAGEFFKDLDLGQPKMQMRRFTGDTKLLTEKDVKDVLVTAGVEKKFYFAKDGRMWDKYATQPENYVNGAAKSHMRLMMVGGKVTITNTREPLVVNLTASGNNNKDTIDVVQTSLSELLHYHTFDYMYANAAREMNERHRGRTAGLPREILRSSLERWLGIEEGLVHATTFKWIKDVWLPRQKDLTTVDLAASIKAQTDQPEYHRLRGYYDMDVSAKELHRLYKEEAHTLVR